jgi:hypothetical protein
VRTSKKDKDKEGLSLWKACGPCVVWEKRDYLKEDKRGLWIFFCIQDYNFKLNVVRKVFLGKKCVCGIEEKEREYGNKLYFDYFNGKWLMYFHVFYWCLVLLRVRKEWRK